MKCSTYPRFHIIFFLSFLFLFVTAANSQYAALNNPYTIQLYQQKDGLPQKNIVGLAADRDGFVWIATNGGIARFDGKQFTVPSISNQYAGNLRAFDITTLNNKVLVRMHDGHVINITPPMKLTVTVDSLYKYGYLFSGGSATLIPGKGWDKAKEDIRRDKEWNWNIYFRHFGYQYTKDTVAIVFFNGIGLYTSQGLVKRIPFTEIKDPSKLLVMDRDFIHLDEEGKDLKVYDHRGILIQKITVPIGTRKIAWGKEPKIFYLFTDSSLYQCHYNANTHNGNIRFVTRFSTRFPINSLMIQKDYIYIGTGEGLYVLKKNKFSNIPLFDQFNNSAGATSLLEVTDIRVITNRNKLISRNGDIKEIPSLANANNRCYYYDSRNRYWFSVFDRKNATVFFSKDITAPPTRITKLPKEELYSYYERSGNKIWVSSYFRIGYIDTDSLKYFRVIDYAPNTRRKDDLKKVYGFAETTDKRLVLMTANGIWIMNTDNEAERLVDTPLLNNSEIRFMERIGNSNTFLTCTYGQGLILTDANNRTVKRISPPNTGLDFVHQFVLDKENRYWFSTNSGLYVTTRENIEMAITHPGYAPYFYRFSTTDGLMDNEFDGGFQQVMIRMKNGDIVTSNSRGLVWFSPADIEFNFTDKKVIIDQVMMNGEYTDFENGIVINDPDNNVANIYISSADRLATENEQIEFKINAAGSNNDNWQLLSGLKNIILTQLKAGNYELTIRKRSGFGNDDFVYTVIPVKVKAYWYQTGYFYALLSVMAILLVYAYFQWRNYRIRQENIKLSKKIADATAELKELNGYLVQNNEVKSKLITMFNHDITGPLFYVQQSLQLYTNNPDIPEEYRKSLQNTRATAEELVEVGEDILQWIKKNQAEGSIKVQPEYFNLEDCFNRNVQLLSAKPNAQPVRFITSGMDGLLVYSDKNVFNSILYNLLSNAIKYGSGRSIEVAMHVQDADEELFTLIVTNHTEKGDVTLSVNNNTDKAARLKDISRGLGLTIVQDGCKLMGYEYVLIQTDTPTTTVQIKNIKGVVE